MAQADPPVHNIWRRTVTARRGLREGAMATTFSVVWDQLIVGYRALSWLGECDGWQDCNVRECRTSG